MLYNKKSLFFRKITAKIVGNSSHKRKGDKCHTVQRAQSSHHHQEKNADGGLPMLIAVTTEKDVAVPSQNLTNAPNTANDTGVHSSNKQAVSGLLAAKLRCDEWGIRGRDQSSTSKKLSTVSSQATSTFSSSPKRRRHHVQRPRLINNKVHHPSYKPSTSQRSASMKERRETMENARKYHNLYFSTSLYRIDEVDEKGLD